MCCVDPIRAVYIVIVLFSSRVPSITAASHLPSVAVMYLCNLTAHAAVSFLTATTEPRHGGRQACVTPTAQRKPPAGRPQHSLPFVPQVETPVLERSAGGAEARPFLTFHNALGRSFALRIATGTEVSAHPVLGMRACAGYGSVLRPKQLL